MSSFKRWSAKVISRIDWAASQIENHESRMTSALQEVQRASARAKVQLNRVHQDGQRLRNDLAEKEQEAELWRSRAVTLAKQHQQETGLSDSTTAEEPTPSSPADNGEIDTPRKKALECLRRAQAAQQALASLRQKQRDHEELERRLRNDLEKVEERVDELRDQRNLLRTRQSRAEALSSVQSALGPGSLDLEDLVDRWETKIVELESTGAASDLTLSSTDRFENQFLETEQEALLEAQLAELLASEPTDAATGSAID